MRHVEEFVVKDTKFEGHDNSSTALELIETTAQIVNGTLNLYAIEKDHTENVLKYLVVSLIVFLRDSLVVQLLLSTVQLISAEADLKITRQTLVELYLQNRRASST